MGKSKSQTDAATKADMNAAHGKKAVTREEFDALAARVEYIERELRCRKPD
jgi:hypothetical protein